jgi:hypothetical protein
MTGGVLDARCEADRLECGKTASGRESGRCPAGVSGRRGVMIKDVNRQSEFSEDVAEDVVVLLELLKVDDVLIAGSFEFEIAIAEGGYRVSNVLNGFEDVARGIWSAVLASRDIDRDSDRFRRLRHE